MDDDVFVVTATAVTDDVFAANVSNAATVSIVVSTLRGGEGRVKN